MLARLKPGRHHLDLSRILGQPLDKIHSHRIKCNTSKYVCILKGSFRNLASEVNLKVISREIEKSIHNVYQITPLASGAFLLEFKSAEALSKALNLCGLRIGGLEVLTVLPSTIQTFDVVIWGQTTSHYLFPLIRILNAWKL